MRGGKAGRREVASRRDLPSISWSHVVEKTKTHRYWGKCNIPDAGFIASRSTGEGMNVKS